MVAIRPVRKSDTAAWLRLRCALWPEASKSEHRGEIEQFFSGQAQEPQEVFLALDAVGLAKVSIRPWAEGCRTKRVAYLEGWYVVPEARGRGIGRALVEAAEEWGRDRGCKELASDTQPDNESSRLAHIALGFEDVGLVRCFRKDL